MLKPNSFSKLLKSSFNKKDLFPLHEPIFSGNEIKYVNRAIESTFVSSIGGYIDDLENKISSYTKNKYSIACVNGTAALHTSLILAGVKQGEEVLTQALSFVATSNAISYLGAKPIFIDVEIDTMGMCPMALEGFLDENTIQREGGTFNKKTGKRISACVPMHTFGFMSKIDEIKKICNKWGINLVEDAAEAFGSKYKGISAGKFGLLSAYSFNGNKIITSGGGGCIVTQNKSLFINAKHLTTTAKLSSDYEYIHDQVGYNYRMPNINAALALAQLENLTKKINEKKKLYDFYKDNLPSIGLELKEEPIDTEWNYWLMCVKLQNKKDRDLFLKETNKNKILTRPIWRLLFKLPMYKNCQRDSQKNAIYLEKRIVNIPSNINYE